jgi:NAD(P)-dependent dehydrogenase (short-subunit alcohol dehydrogenase family)
MGRLLVTGANRGIGLEHVRQALAAGDEVVAACRAPQEAVALKDLEARHGGALRVEALDVVSPASIEALGDRLGGAALDILINNAGVYGRPEAQSWTAGDKAQSLEGMDYAHWEDTLRINVMGPFRLTARLLPNLIRGAAKLVVMMSSDLGSIAKNSLGGSHAYRTSKAALNMLARGLAVDLKPAGICVIAMAPGWTRTDLGGAAAPWSPEDSVAAQRAVLSTIRPEDSGRFIDLNGMTVPW